MAASEDRACSLYLELHDFHGSVTLRYAQRSAAMIPQQHTDGQGWLRVGAVAFLRTLRGSLEFLRGIAEADGSWGMMLSGCAELVCSLGI